MIPTLIAVGAVLGLLASVRSAALIALAVALLWSVAIFVANREEVSSILDVPLVAALAVGNLLCGYGAVRLVRHLVQRWRSPRSDTPRQTDESAGLTSRGRA